MSGLLGVDYRLGEQGHQKVALFGQTASTTATTISPDREISAYRIQNNDAAITLTVSEDGGSTTRTILYLQTINVITVNVKSLQITAASGTPTYDLEYTMFP